MRPLFHPAIEDVTVEGILHALSDPVRVRMFAQLVAEGEAQTCTSLTAGLEKPVPKSTLSQHFKVLRESGLVRSERQGVELRSSPRTDELERRFPGLLRALSEAFRRQQNARRKR